MRVSSITKNAGKACNNRLYRHIRTFEKIIKNYFVIYVEKPDEYDGFHHAVCFLPGCRWEDIVGFSDAEIQEYQKVIESSAEQIMHLAASSKG